MIRRELYVPVSVDSDVVGPWMIYLDAEVVRDVRQPVEVVVSKRIRTEIPEWIVVAVVDAPSAAGVE